MAIDATGILIERIQKQLSQSAQLTPNAASSNQFNVIASNAATYAQLLGTAAGPIGQAAAIATAGGATAAVKDAAGQAAQLAASAEAAGVGAVIVLALSFILGALGADQQSDQTQQFDEVIDNINNTVVASY